MHPTHSVRKRAHVILVAVCALLCAGGCRSDRAAPHRELEAAPATQATSAWYRELRQEHGDRLSVGTVPVGADIGVWISSTSEAKPTSAEFQQFYEGLSKPLRELGRQRLPNVDFLKIAYLGGDFLGDRTEVLLFDAAVYAGHVELFIEVLELVQRYLQAPEHRQYRLAYFSPSASLLIYPDAVFVGPRRFARPGDAREALVAWLEQIVAEERAARAATPPAAP